MMIELQSYERSWVGTQVINLHNLHGLRFLRSQGERALIFAESFNEFRPAHLIT